MDLLILAPNDFESLEKKSVLYQYENYREDGYFDNVISFFPFTKTNLVKKIDNNKFFYQYGWQTTSKILNNFKILKIFRTIIVIWKVLFVFPFVIQKHNIKVIRATDPYLHGLLGLYYSKLFRIPLTVSVHSDYALCNEAGGLTFKLFGSRKLAEKLEHFVYKKCHAILPISEYLIRQIHFYYPDIALDKLYKFPHGIEANEFDSMEYLDIFEKFGISKSKKLICYVARLSKEKNCLDLPLIVERLSERYQDFVLLVIGDGKEFNTIQQIIKKKYLDTYIKMVGFQNKEIVFNARKTAAVNVCLLDGYSLLEAGLSERPVVAYDVEWHSDLISDKLTGYLIKLHDIETFSEKLSELLMDEKHSNNFGKALKRFTLETHELKNTQKIKQYIYTKIIEEYKCSE